MPERRSPTLRRRRLSTVLTQLRATAKLTGAEVEKRMGWSPGKVSRMELGQWVLPNLRDVKDLLELYGVADEAVKEELLTWARDGRQRGWWSQYKDLITDKYGLYIGLEAETKTLSTYQNSVVPGLFQTADYARSLMSNAVRALSEEEVEKRVEVRLARQKLLQGDDALKIVAVLDEAVLHRIIGSEQVMRSQIKRLVQVAEMPNVAIYLTSFEKVRNVSTHTSFSIMEFPDPNDRKSVYVELLTGELFIEDPEDLRIYELAFGDHLGSSMDRDQTLDMLRTFDMSR